LKLATVPKNAIHLPLEKVFHVGISKNKKGAMYLLTKYVYTLNLL